MSSLRRALSLHFVHYHIFSCTTSIHNDRFEKREIIIHYLDQREYMDYKKELVYSINKQTVLFIPYRSNDYNTYEKTTGHNQG